MISSRLVCLKCYYVIPVLLAVRLLHTVHAQQSLCAQVKIEILQELTLEREAFEGRMTINNGLTGVALDNISVDVTFADRSNHVVRATSDPNDLTAKFYIRLQDGNAIPPTIPGGTTARITWLILPTRGAAGQNPQGELYYVGATLRYRAGGESQEVQVSPDSIYVKPLPDLTLDYFLPIEVYGDNPLTENFVEPVVPFSLGVRVKNSGYGTARKLKIESAQPRIIENKLGLLVDFRITGSEVNGRAATPSLLCDFGDIAANRSGVARWIMISTLSGRFVEFAANYTHADELGGQLTSLISGQPRTHFLVHDVLVDLPGRDAIRDFLALDGNVLRVYESENADTVAADLSASSSITGEYNRYTVSTIPSSGFVFIKLPDPYAGQQVLKSATRADGKPIALANAWLSQTWITNGAHWDYFVNVFDINNTSGRAYNLEYDVPPAPTNRPPRLSPISNWTLSAGNYLSFPVTASDPDGNTVRFALEASVPAGAAMDPVTGLFTWRPTEAQAGSTNVIRVRATDNGTPSLSDQGSFTVIVKGNTAPQLPPIPAHFANVLSRLTLTNQAVDADLPANILLYTLEPGAPEGARVNPTNGVFSWTPTREQAPSTNDITITVTDNGNPPLSVSRTFQVMVNDYMELTIGSAPARAGQPGSVPLMVFSSAPLTNVTFVVDYPEGRFVDWDLQTAAQVSGGLGGTNDGRMVLLCAPAGGQFLQHTQALGELRFATVTNQESAFVPLTIAAATGLRPDGTTIPWTLLNHGLVTLIANEALVTPHLRINQDRFLVLYGKPGSRYWIDVATNMSQPVSWQPAGELTLTNFSAAWNVPWTNTPVLFSRARE